MIDVVRRAWRATIDGQRGRYYASEEARRRHAERWADQLQQPVALHDLTAEGTWAASGTIEPQRTFHDQAGFRIHPWNNPTGRYVVPPETPAPDRAPTELIHLAHHLFAARAYAFEPIHRTDGQWILASEDDIPDVVTVITDAAVQTYAPAAWIRGGSPLATVPAAPDGPEPHSTRDAILSAVDKLRQLHASGAVPTPEVPLTPEQQLTALLADHADIASRRGSELEPLYVAANRTGDFSKVDDASRSYLEEQADLADQFADATRRLIGQ